MISLGSLAGLPINHGRVEPEEHMAAMRFPLSLVGLLLAATIAAPGAANPDHVQFETEDGVIVHGRFFAPETELRTAALYLHQPGRSGTDWEYMAGRLAEMGVAGLAIDLRGHGESRTTVGGEVIDRELFGPDDFYAMSMDVAAAVAYLRDERAMAENGLQLIGADVGGSAAMLYAVEDWGVESMAMLSPGLLYDGVDMVGQVARFGQRPLLMVVSIEDAYAAKSADVLRREAKGFFHLETYYGVGHGTKMLNREPGLEPLLISWVLGTFQMPAGVSLAEHKALLSQDKSQGLVDMEALAAEEKARANRDLETAEADEDNQQTAEDEEERPRRWD